MLVRRKSLVHQVQARPDEVAQADSLIDGIRGILLRTVYSVDFTVRNLASLANCAGLMFSGESLEPIQIRGIVG